LHTTTWRYSVSIQHGVLDGGTFREKKGLNLVEKVKQFEECMEEVMKEKENSPRIKARLERITLKPTTTPKMIPVILPLESSGLFCNTILLPSL
jgi:hypothetical protein